MPRALHVRSPRPSHFRAAVRHPVAPMNVAVRLCHGPLVAVVVAQGVLNRLVLPRSDDQPHAVSAQRNRLEHLLLIVLQKQLYSFQFWFIFRHNFGIHVFVYEPIDLVIQYKRSTGIQEAHLHSFHHCLVSGSATVTVIARSFSVHTIAPFCPLVATLVWTPLDLVRFQPASPQKMSGGEHLEQQSRGTVRDQVIGGGGGPADGHAVFLIAVNILLHRDGILDQHFGTGWRAVQFIDTHLLHHAVEHLLQMRHQHMNNVDVVVLSQLQHILRERHEHLLFDLPQSTRRVCVNLRRLHDSGLEILSNHDDVVGNINAIVSRVDMAIASRHVAQDVSGHRAHHVRHNGLVEGQLHRHAIVGHNHRGHVRAVRPGLLDIAVQCTLEPAHLILLAVHQDNIVGHHRMDELRVLYIVDMRAERHILHGAQTLFDAAVQAGDLVRIRQQALRKSPLDGVASQHHSVLLVVAPVLEKPP
mmetsp:Transcript_19485/g.36311  ORF Transcript_19485/g.36311 Transcript_19485/m.36311 type:complete len:472 (+) Transcript_19485:173-1588(+)